MQFKRYGSTFKKAIGAIGDDKITTQSAALSYCTVFSIAPLLLITIAVASLFWGAEAVRGELFGSIRGLLGDQGAAAIQSFVQSATVTGSNIVATVIGVVTLIIGATSLFAQLQDTLNTIWRVKSKPHGGIWPLLRQRLLSLGLILVIAFVLLVSLVLSAVLAAMSKFAQGLLPASAFVWHIVDIVVSLGVTSALFAAIFKILPDVKLSWKNVARGAIITSVLFTLGKIGIGLYLGRSSVSSSYGAAGSLVVVLLWTYYSSIILLFGAEFTRFDVLSRTAKINLKKDAVWMSPPTETNTSVSPKAA